MLEKTPEPYDYGNTPPEIANLFEQITLYLVKEGFEKYSARAILHRIRWHYNVEKKMRDFTCNNNWTPKLARWIMSKHPELEGFFEIRASPNSHNMDDYGGPYGGKDG